jgi:hypothetical protein
MTVMLFEFIVLYEESSRPFFFLVFLWNLIATNKHYFSMTLFFEKTNTISIFSQCISSEVIAENFGG